MPTFVFHPPGITVKIIGMECNTHGMRCCAHHTCGSLLAEDGVVHFRKLQILVDDKEQTVIGAHHVSDGIDCCCIGFLKSDLSRFSELYEGLLARVVDVRPDCSVVVIISCLSEETIQQMTRLKEPATWKATNLQLKFSNLHLSLCFKS